MQKQKQDKKHTSQYNFNLSSLIQPFQQQKIVSLPIQFQYLPVDILSKQFTKLNSHHQYRIHYLGPRFQNSYNLHKKFSIAGAYNQKGYSKSLDEQEQIQRYQINMRKVVQSHFITEKMKNNQHYRSAIYYRAFQGMNPTLDKQKQFVFNSAFQSGNLDCVIKVKERQFDLFLRIDSNTRGHLQWYYFSVKNSNKIGKIVLHICNISKSGTLYEAGLKPYIYSRQKFLKQGKQWQQGGSCLIKQSTLRYNIIYEKINPPQLNELTIQYEFQQENDQVFFAYCVPYTYSKLLKDINGLPLQFVKVDKLGRSLTGVDIPILHITNHQYKVKKKNVLITGRVHPGQSNGSYLLKGFIDFLCSKDKDAKQLLIRVNFIIIPMINPDGVIMGNTRTSAAGKDLNREYRSSNQQMFPQSCLVKSIAYKIKKKYGLDFYLDFHGHSRKKNTFFYGPAFIISQAQYYKCRILPKMIQKLTNPFRFYSCSFLIGQQKKTTARAVFFQQFRIPYTYTIQSSIGFYYDSELKTIFPFNKQSWLNMGLNIAKGFSTFVVSLEQFEEMIKQRRLQRKRQRERKQKQFQKKISNNKKFAEDQRQELTSTAYKQMTQSNIFLDMINQIKAMPVIKNPDPQLSSDDHDEKQDLQYSKYAEFNTLVSGKKDPNFAKTKLQGLQEMQKSSKKKEKTEQKDKDKDQLNIINQIAQQKFKVQKDKIKLTVEKKVESFSKRSSLSERRNQFIVQKKIHPHFTRKYPESQNYQSSIEKKVEKIQKIIAKKLVPSESKCLVLTKQFFPQSKCQILQMPKKLSTQTTRRQKAVVVTPRLQTRNQSRGSSNSERNTKNLSQDKFNLKDKIKIISSSRNQDFDRFNLSQLPGPKSAKSSRRKYPFYQSTLFTIKQNYSTVRKKQDNFFQDNDINFQIMEIDNMAMTIRTYNK